MSQPRSIHTALAVVAMLTFGSGTDTLRFDGRQLSMLRYVELECDEYSGERHLASFVYR